VREPSTRIAWNARVLFTLGGFSTAIFLPFFVLLLRDRGLAPDSIGFVVAASAAASLVAGPVWSHFADTRLGTARTLVASSLTTTGAALALMAAGSNVWAILGTVVILGVAQAPGAPLSDSLALGTLGGRETEYGRIRLWTSAGWAVASIGFGAWFQHEGLDSLLPFYAASTIAFAAVAARFPRIPPLEPGPTGSRLGAVGAVLRANRRFAMFLFGASLAAVATQAAWTFVPLVIATGGGGPFLVGLSAGLAAIIEIPVFAAGGRLGRLASQRTLYLTGVGIYVATMLAWAITQNPDVVSVLRATSGVAFALVYSTLVVITGRLVPDQLRNTGQALLGTTSRGLSPIVGSAVGGLVYTHLGVSTLFLGAAACAAVGAAIVWLALRDRGT
jgi:MFS family permease